MQQLTVVQRLFPLIVSGEKTSTIRWREMSIEPGLMKYVCDADPSQAVVVEVTRCTTMPLAQAAGFLGKSDLWPDSVMLEGMREHYPDISLSDQVQVIEHLSPAA